MNGPGQPSTTRPTLGRHGQKAVDAAGGVPRRWRDLPRALGRIVSRHRRILAAILAAASVVSGVLAARPAPAATVEVITAARDLTGGTRLHADDLRVRSLPADAVPDGALHRGGTGRLLAAPMREGEPLTDVRLLGRRIAAGYGANRVATPIRVADPAEASLVQVGDRIDVLAAATQPGKAERPARTVVGRAPVIAVPRGEDDVDAGALGGAAPAAGRDSGGGLVVVAATRADAAAVASAATTAQLSLTVSS